MTFLKYHTFIHISYLFFFYFLPVFLHHLLSQKKDRQASVENSQRYSEKIHIAVMSCTTITYSFPKKLSEFYHLKAGRFNNGNHVLRTKMSPMRAL